MAHLKSNLVWFGIAATFIFPGWLCRPCQADSPEHSYNEVMEALDSSRLDSLPERPTVGAGTILASFLEASTHTAEELRAIVKPGSFIDRILRTFSTDDDFKDDDRAKYIHSMGVCAPAEWKIDRSAEIGGQPLMGLFAPASNAVRGIVRLSVSVDAAKYKPGEKRAWGFALKLFPGSDPNQPVQSRNLLFFDRYGLDGSDRPLVMVPPAGDHSVQFINYINETAATSLSSRAISALFSFFDVLATYRPLEGFSEVTAENTLIPVPNVPTFLVLRARPLPPAQALDFRDELRSYPAGSITFDIFVSGSRGEDLAAWDTKTLSKTLTVKALALHELLDDPGNPQAPAPIGTLTLGHPEVSTDCDLRLHFAHDPNYIDRIAP